MFATNLINDLEGVKNCRCLPGQLDCDRCSISPSRCATVQLYIRWASLNFKTPAPPLIAFVKLFKLSISFLRVVFRFHQNIWTGLKRSFYCGTLITEQEFWQIHIFHTIQYSNIKDHWQRSIIKLTMLLIVVKTFAKVSLQLEVGLMLWVERPLCPNFSK